MLDIFNSTDGGDYDDFVSINTTEIAANATDNDTDNGGPDYPQFVYTWKDTERQILGLVTGVIGVLTIPWLFIVTLTPIYRRLSYTVYLSVMSIYDLVFVMLVFTNAVFKYWEDMHIRDELLWEVPCRLYDHLIYTSSVISIWLNVSLALDRYIVISRPFKRDTYCTRRNGWILTLSIMGVVHCLGIAYLVEGKVVYVPILGRDRCNGNPIVYDLDAYMDTVCGIIPAVTLIVVLNVMSVVELSRHAARRRKMTHKKDETTCTKPTQRTSKATYSLVTIGIVTMICQLPNAANELLLTYTREEDKEFHYKLLSSHYPIYADAVQVFQSIKLLTHIQNFFILFIMNSDFRMDAIALLMCRFSERAKLKRTRSASTRVGPSGSSLK